MTYTHTYSDGSKIELGSEPGKGCLSVLKARHQASEAEAAQSDPLLSDISDDEWDHLIGAAPKMLEALKGMMRLRAPDLLTNAERAEIINSAIAAIAAAQPAPRQITGKQAHLVDDLTQPGRSY